MCSCTRSGTCLSMSEVAPSAAFRYDYLHVLRAASLEHSPPITLSGRAGVTRKDSPPPGPPPSFSCRTLSILSRITLMISSHSLLLANEKKQELRFPHQLMIPTSRVENPVKSDPFAKTFQPSLRAGYDRGFRIHKCMCISYLILHFAFIIYEVQCELLLFSASCCIGRGLVSPEKASARLFITCRERCRRSPPVDTPCCDSLSSGRNPLLKTCIASIRTASK